jgi:hypothetical protein
MPSPSSERKALRPVDRNDFNAVVEQRDKARAERDDWKAECAFVGDERDKAIAERDDAYALLRLYVPHGKPPCQYPSPEGRRCCECAACHAYGLLPEALSDVADSAL